MPAVGSSIFAVILLFGSLWSKDCALILCEGKKKSRLTISQQFSNMNNSEHEKKVSFSSSGLWGNKSKHSHLSSHCLYKNSVYVRLHCKTTTKFIHIHKLIITFQSTLTMPHISSSIRAYLTHLQQEYTEITLSYITHTDITIFSDWDTWQNSIQSDWEIQQRKPQKLLL